MSPRAFNYCVFSPKNEGPNPRRRPLQRLVLSGKMIQARKKLRKKFLRSRSIAKLSEEFSILNKPFWDGAKRRPTLWKSKSTVVPFLIRWSLPVNFLRKKFQSRAPLQRMKWLTSLVLPREKDSKVTVHLYLSFITFETLLNWWVKSLSAWFFLKNEIKSLGCLTKVF